MQKEDNAVCFGIGILIGAAAGAIAAVLYAPKSGCETRKTIENAAVKIAEKCAPEVTEAKRRALSSIDVIRYKIEKQYEKIFETFKAKQLAKAKEKETIDYEVN